MNGILLIDKPAGWTSFDVVNYVRKIARQSALTESYKVHKVKSDQTLNFEAFKLSTPLPKVKVGHTGTLDPLATGLLILLIGKEYTKHASELSKFDKTYEVAMRLGETSTTGDAEGKITFVSNKQPTQQEVERVLQKFTGEIMQTPPVFSAMKINGQRAYKLARAGKEVKLEPRKVKVYRLQLTGYRYPEVKFAAEVSSGTYIRSLAEDLGKELATGAYMSGLRRTKVGKFDIKGACQPTDEDLLQHLRSL